MDANWDSLEETHLCNSSSPLRCSFLLLDSLSSKPSASPSDAPSRQPSSPSSTTVIVSGSVSLSNFSPPSTQEEVDSVVSVLEATIAEAATASLTATQSIVGVEITSIDGQPVSQGASRLRRRYLESTSVNVECDLTLQDMCADCGTSEETAAALFDLFSASLSSAVESGSFETALKVQALLAGNADSLLHAVVESGEFFNYTTVVDGQKQASPTSQPSRKPTLPPVDDMIAVSASPTASPTSVVTKELASSSTKTRVAMNTLIALPCVAFALYCL